MSTYNSPMSDVLPLPHPTIAIGTATSYQSSPLKGHHELEYDYAPWQQAGPSRPRAHDGRIGVEEPMAERAYTEIKCLGDGSFGTVWLCDWHSPVQPGTLLSAMQCGAGARAEWAGKRLVALKKMKRVWEGGWNQAMTLGELKSLSEIPTHPAIIPLYDAFISPQTRELYFVFEPMEGNLYQLTKSRGRTRHFAAGLIASAFHQITQGLDHMHTYGYFHRDMKPENLLVTTTGITDYFTASTLNAINAQRTENVDLPPGIEIQTEKDVMVIIKIADFGLARAMQSAPPYTEYVSTRWYRAPEVLLRSRDYNAPVDMWAMGTILAEMLNLKPLFPGVSEIDQVFRITEVLGNPSSSNARDERGVQIGGGPWNTGVKLAKNVGFSFPKRNPVVMRTLFRPEVPQTLVDCIADLLRFNPRFRLTAAQCIRHPYFRESLPHIRAMPPLPKIPFAQGQPAPARAQPRVSELVAPPRSLPPSHSHSSDSRPAFANGDMRTLPPPIGTPDSSAGRIAFPALSSDSRNYTASSLVSQLRALDLPSEDLASYGQRAHEPAREPPISSLSVSNLGLINRQHHEPRATSNVMSYVQSQAQEAHVYDQAQLAGSSISVAPPIEPTEGGAQIPAISKKKKWGLSSVFGSSEKHLPPVQEVGYSGSTLKRTQSGNPAQMQALEPMPAPILDPKKAKKEAERQARELEKAKREAAIRAQQERARAVMRKREQVSSNELASGSIRDISVSGTDPGASSPNMSLGQGNNGHSHSQGLHGYSRTDLRQSQPVSASLTSIPSGESTHALSSVMPGNSSRHHLSAANLGNMGMRDPLEDKDPANRYKARRRDGDGDHSVSSLGVDSIKSRSVLTVGTVDSDPGPRRHHNDPLLDAQARRAHALKGHRPSSRSQSRLMSGSNPSLESQLANDFRQRANLASPSASSLGRLGGSSMNLHDPSASSTSFGGPSGGLAAAGASSYSFLDPRMGVHGHGYGNGHSLGEGHGLGLGSAPTSPYGQPQGKAVAMGHGIGRQHPYDLAPQHQHAHGSGEVLPGLDGERDRDGYINPIFRVPPMQDQQKRPTLPPFSAIANMADKSRNGER